MNKSTTLWYWITLLQRKIQNSYILFLLFKTSSGHNSVRTRSFSNSTVPLEQSWQHSISNFLFLKKSHLSPFPSQSHTELPLSPWQPRGEPKPMHGPRPSGLRKPFQVISLSLSLLAECYVTPGRNCGQIDKRVKIKRS